MAHERQEYQASLADIRVNEEIGRRIERLRKSRGFKAAKFAHAVQISPQRLYGYEVGRVACPPAVLARIAHGLAVTVDELVPQYCHATELPNSKA